MGANRGRAKGNEQEAEYEEPGRKAREIGLERTGKAKEAKAERAHRGSHCEAEAGREGKEAQRLSSQNPKLKRTKECRNRGGQKAEGKRRKSWNGRPREVGSESGQQG